MATKLDEVARWTDCAALGVPMACSSARTSQPDSTDSGEEGTVAWLGARGWLSKGFGCRRIGSRQENRGDQSELEVLQEESLGAFEHVD